MTQRPEPHACPFCGLVMSWRETNEQGCCNDCYDGRARWIHAARNTDEAKWDQLTLDVDP